MKMKCLLTLLLAVTVCLTASLALADDVVISDGVNPIAFSELGYLANYTVIHADEDDGYGFKGWAYAGLQNTGTEAWNGLSLYIFDATVGETAYDATSVLFIGADPYEPSSSTHTIDSWSIGVNESGHATMDIVFSETIDPAEILLVQFYTDNTAEQVPYFGVGFYPVPEPATGSLVALAGFVAVFIRKRYGFRR